MRMSAYYKFESAEYLDVCRMIISPILFSRASSYTLLTQRLTRQRLPLIISAKRNPLGFVIATGNIASKLFFPFISAFLLIMLFIVSLGLWILQRFEGFKSRRFSDDIIREIFDSIFGRDHKGFCEFFLFLWTK